jgi:tight adherence protein C
MPIGLTIALFGVFLAVALMAGSATYVAFERQSSASLRRRLSGTPEVSSADVESPMDNEQAGEAMKRMATFIPKSPKEMSKLQRRLAAGGYYQPSHVLAFAFSEIALALLVGVLPLVVLGFRRGLIYGALGAIAGYLFPSFYLERKVQRRRRMIQNGLPDALDLLIVSLEAGLALDQAILRCGEELRIAHPALAEELRLVNVECRAGKPRIEAFKNFANRTKVDDVRSLVAMLVQTDRFGTSVAQALRTHAEVSRTKRRQRAEEAAAKLGVKLVFPLVFCLFPAFYVVVLGPAVIKFKDAFGSGGYINSGGLR